MGANRDNFVKYPRTPHLFGSKGTADDRHWGRRESEAFIRDPSLIIEEKLDGTNVTRQTRQRWINLFHDYGARIEIVYLEPALEVILARNSRRQHPVPTRVILHLADRLEPPTAAECHGLTLVGEPPHGCSSPTIPLAPMKP